MQRGDMTIADLAKWFGRSYHTVWFWVEDNRKPRTARRGLRGKSKQTYARLDLLEEAIKRKRGLPIPLDLTQYERPDYVEKLRHDLETSRVPASGVAR